MFLDRIRSQLNGRERSVDLPQIREIERYLAISILYGYPAFLLPNSIRLDEPELWIHEFVEASLWDIMPRYRFWSFGIFQFSLIHAVTSMSCQSFIGSRSVSPDEFWEMVFQFYDKKSQVDLFERASGQVEGKELTHHIGSDRDT